MSVEFEIASDQIDGARDYQEDTYMVTQLGEADNGKICALAILADGMGGHAAGNVASNIAVAIFNISFQSSFPTKEVEATLTDALNRSNEQIRTSVKEIPALRGMGCTMVPAYLEGDELFWVSVGNANCFDCMSDFRTSKPAKVGTYQPNLFGLYDTAGNMFEWVHDCYHRSYKDAPTDGSVWQGGDCDVRIVRGGATAARPAQCE